MVQLVFTKKNILTFFFVVIYFFVMIRSIWGGYDTMGLLGATLGGHILITLLLTLLVIERQKEIKKSLFLKIVRGIVIVFSLLAFTQGVSKGLGIFARNSAYLVYSYLTWLAIINQRRISLWTVATTGISSLSILISVGYMALSLSYAKPFDVDCLNLKQQTIGILSQYFPSHMASSNSTMNSVGSFVEKFGNKTLGQVVGVGSGVLVGSGSNVFSGDIVLQESGTLLSALELYKKDLIDDFLANKNVVDQGVCDFTLSHIQKITANSTFQISAVILLTLLILVFLNTLFIVVGIIIFIVLFILYKTKVYKSTYVTEKAERIT